MFAPYERFIAGLVHACSEAGKKIAQEMAMAGDIQPLLLHYKPATDTISGDLVLIPRGAEVPAGYALATSDPLHSAVPYEGYYQWVRERCRSLPVISASI